MSAETLINEFFSSSLMDNPKRIAFYVFLCFLMLLFLAANIVSLHPNPKTDVFFKDLIENTTNHTIEEVGYIGGPFFVGFLFIL